MSYKYTDIKIIITILLLFSFYSWCKNPSPSVWEIKTIKTNSYNPHQFTAFFVGPNQVITTTHVLFQIYKKRSNLQHLYLQHPNYQQVLKIKRILYISIDDELALLQVEGGTDAFLKLSPTSTNQQEKDLSIIGYSKDKIKTIHQVSDIISKNHYTYFYTDQSNLLHSSGGPVINSKQQVVGVLTASIDNLAFTTSFNRLQNFLQQSREFVVTYLNPSEYIKKEFDQLVKLANAGNATAQISLFRLYQQLEYFFAYKKDIQYWINQLTHQNDPVSHYIVGTYFYHQSQPSLAFTWIYKSALASFTPAESFLGEMYLLGQGVGQNLEKAAYWLNKAVKKKCVIAQFQLGMVHLQTNHPDPERIKYWLTQAAKKGLVQAQTQLGKEYASGQYLKKDIKKAKNWLHKAISQGSQEAKQIFFEIISTQNAQESKVIHLRRSLALSSEETLQTSDTQQKNPSSKKDLTTDNGCRNPFSPTDPPKKE